MTMRPKRNPEVVWRIEKGMHDLAWEKARQGEEYEEMGVLTLMVRGTIHQLNLVGAEIWTRINGVNSVERIASEIAEIFDADPKEIEKDVTEFLQDAAGKGWVTLGGGDGPAGPKWAGQ